MNEKPISTLQQIHSDTLGDSVYTTEEVNGKTSVVEYQVRRFVRDDMNKQTIQDTVAQLEDTKSKLIELGDQLPDHTDTMPSFTSEPLEEEVLREELNALGETINEDLNSSESQPIENAIE